MKIQIVRNFVLYTHTHIYIFYTEEFPVVRDQYFKHQFYTVYFTP
jgi:hypothetical protein